MGTKIHTSTFLREFHSVIDLDATTSNAMRSCSYGMLQNGKNPVSVSCYDIEKVRQTILEHESIFKNQLRELHRLYGRHRELMNEIKRRGIVRDDGMEEKLQLLSNAKGSSSYSSSTYSYLGFSANLYRNGYGGDTSIANPTKGGVDRRNKEGSLSIRKERSGKEHLFDKHGVNFWEKRRGDGHSLSEEIKLVAFPRSEFLNSPLDIGTSLSRKRKKIFGVEISEGDNDVWSDLDPRAGAHDRVEPSDSLVQRSLSLHERNERLKTGWGMNNANIAAAEALKKDAEHSQKSSDIIHRGNQETSKGSLPWFLRDSQESSDLKKTKGSYFMNLDSLQSCSHKFFKKQNSNPEKEQVEGVMSEVGIDVNAPKNHLGIEQVGLSSFIPDLRHCIDLNLSLDEEEAPPPPPPPPSVPCAIVKIAAAEIEGPAVVECELGACPNSDQEPSPLEEGESLAAEVMIAISSHVEKKRDDDNSFTRLKWFARVISSEKTIPWDMDDFEFMTLKLEETKEEHPPYKPSLKDPSGEEALARRTRSRRGRYFQRDILPGLVTLSRLQVTEDFQAFKELLKAGDGTRNGRGRKPITVKAACSSHAEIEERSLAGWGKKTRRLPRQRCPTTLLSFPLKC